MLLTFLALERRRRALLASLFATVGAVFGGLAMYAWGVADPAGALAAVDAVPAVAPQAIEQARRALEHQGLLALFVGAVTGRPYKIYAVQSAVLGIGPAWFVVASLPARLFRFALAAWIASAISRALAGRLSVGTRVAVLAALWVAFYAVYLSSMPW